MTSPAQAIQPARQTLRVLQRTPVSRFQRCLRGVAQFTALVLIASSAQFASAADPEVFATKLGALRGTDVVAYFSLDKDADAVMGDVNITHEYKGATWHFSTPANRELFIAEPEKYLPQYGGYCAFAVSHGFTKPADPDSWNIVGGKLYVNLNRAAERKWLRDRDSAINRANKNWPTVLQACEKRKKCRS